MSHTESHKAHKHRSCRTPGPCLSTTVLPQNNKNAVVPKQKADTQQAKLWDFHICCEKQGRARTTCSLVYHESRTEHDTQYFQLHSMDSIHTQTHMLSTHPVVFGHLPVLPRRAHLQRQQHPSPVLHLVVADGQPKEVHTVVGVDAFRNALLRLPVGLRKQPGRPAVAIVEILVRYISGRWKCKSKNILTRKSGGGGGGVRGEGSIEKQASGS